MRITKILEIFEIHIKKKKQIDVHMRITKIMKILENHENHRKPIENHNGNHQNLNNLYEIIKQNKM